MMNHVDEILDLLRRELESAQQRFPPFHSRDEGYAVIEKKFLELQREVFQGTGERAHHEAKQLAAMAVRFMLDLYDGPPAEAPRDP